MDDKLIEAVVRELANSDDQVNMCRAFNDAKRVMEVVLRDTHRLNAYLADKGLAVVPIEPTDAMIEEGMKQASTDLASDDTSSAIY